MLGQTYFFTGRHNKPSSSFVSFYNKMWLRHGDTGSYIRAGDFVVYRIKPSRDGGTTKVGRLKWLISVHGRQYIILQKVRKIPQRNGPIDGETFVEQFFRQRRGKSSSLDPLQRLFWQLEVLTASHEIVSVCEGCDSSHASSCLWNCDKCVDADWESPLDCHIIVQPDLSSRSESGDDWRRWYLVDYDLS